MNEIATNAEEHAIIIPKDKMKRCIIGDNVIEFKVIRDGYIKTLALIPLDVVGGVEVV